MLITEAPRHRARKERGRQLRRGQGSADRVLYALSVALPELPPASASILTAAVNGDRAAAEKIAEAARRSVTVNLAGVRCRTGRVRIGGGGAQRRRGTTENRL